MPPSSTDDDVTLSPLMYLGHKSQNTNSGKDSSEKKPSSGSNKLGSGPGISSDSPIDAHASFNAVENNSSEKNASNNNKATFIIKELSEVQEDMQAYDGIEDKMEGEMKEEDKDGRPEVEYEDDEQGEAEEGEEGEDYGDQLDGSRHYSPSKEDDEYDYQFEEEEECSDFMSDREDSPSTMPQMEGYLMKKFQNLCPQDLGGIKSPFDNDTIPEEPSLNHTFGS